MAFSRAAGPHPATTALGLLVLLLACPTLQQLHASPSTLPSKRSQLSEDDILQTFHQWIIDYGRVYSSILEQQRRFDIFRDNLLYILDVNEQKGLPYELGLNNFTDLTEAEFLEHYVELNPELELALSALAAATKFECVDVELKESVDWREIVNQVRDVILQENVFGDYRRIEHPSPRSEWIAYSRERQNGKFPRIHLVHVDGYGCVPGPQKHPEAADLKAQIASPVRHRCLSPGPHYGLSPPCQQGTAGSCYDFSSAEFIKSQLLKPRRIK